MSLALIVAGIAVFIGATAQRATGLGFGLVAVPFLLLVLGAHDGVAWANLLSVCVAVLILSTSWHHLDFHRTLKMVCGALLGVVPGVLLGRLITPALIQVCIGTLVLLALIMIVTTRKKLAIRWFGGAVSAGFLSGFMGSAAGVGGPALAIYAKASKWYPLAFVPTAQLVFMVTGVTALATRGMPVLALPFIWLLPACLILGLGLGQFIAPRISSERAMNTALVFAGLGSLVTIVMGVRLIIN